MSDKPITLTLSLQQVNAVLTAMTANELVKAFLEVQKQATEQVNAQEETTDAVEK